MSRPKIQDQFTDAPLSRQRKWQLRRVLEGKCHICGVAPLAGATLCLKCLIKSRERQRQRRVTKRRYNSLSYRLEQAK